MFESTKIIGQKQYEKAKSLFDSATTKIEGPLGFVHQYVDMSNVQLQTSNGTVTTCKPAMGYSFAAGTTDGPGAFDFQQGITKATPFWNLVRDFMKRPSPELTQCHFPKPILVATGEMKFPYQWQPTVLPVQILRIGSVLNVGLPAEFTTMAGRRVREAVLLEATSASADTKWNVMLSGLSNAYSSYVVTPEEYQVQRYEGASTIFGPHTLPAYIQQFILLTHHAVKATEVPSSGLQPPYLLPKQISLKPGVVYDGIPFGKKFGDLVYDVKPRYSVGDQVYTSFYAANPRNNLQQERSFLTIERKEADHWFILSTDADWETKFYWHRTNSIFGESKATITWDIPANTTKGIYRIRHFGASKSLLQTIKSYIGVSSEFEVV
jgi:neutral ceramidase